MKSFFASEEANHWDGTCTVGAPFGGTVRIKGSGTSRARRRRRISR